MLRYISSHKMGHGMHGWLDSFFHFSFAEYYNPSNIHFGALRVVNDDRVQPGTGFDTHDHANMEILSYVVNGELTHADSMGNQRTLKRGQVQYMSAGTGVEHSEHNYGHDELRFLQIWIFPDAEGYEPNYGDVKFNFDDRVGHWLPIATSYKNEESQAPIRMHADINAYASVILTGETATFPVKTGRQAYMVLIEGEAEVDGIEMKQRDALEIVEQGITISAKKNAHVLIIEMEKP